MLSESSKGRELWKLLVSSLNSLKRARKMSSFALLAARSSFGVWKILLDLAYKSGTLLIPRVRSGLCLFLQSTWHHRRALNLPTRITQSDQLKMSYQNQYDLIKDKGGWNGNLKGGSRLGRTSGGLFGRWAKEIFWIWAGRTSTIQCRVSILETS
jgi:hypothetical protein